MARTTKAQLEARLENARIEYRKLLVRNRELARENAELRAHGPARRAVRALPERWTQCKFAFEAHFRPRLPVERL